MHFKLSYHKNAKHLNKELCVTKAEEQTSSDIYSACTVKQNISKSTIPRLSVFSGL